MKTENGKRKTQWVETKIEPVYNRKNSASVAVREEHVRPSGCERKSVLSRQGGGVS